MSAAGRRQRRTADQDPRRRTSGALGGRRELAAVGVVAAVAVALIAVALGPLGWHLPVAAPAGSAGSSSAASAGSSSAASLPAGPSGDGNAAASGPALEFEPVALAGQGDRRVAFEIPAGAAALAKVSNRGSGPFHLQTLTVGDAPDQVLVDTAGDYDGLLLFDALAGQHSAAFDVHSGGAWTITVEPVGLAPSWSGDVPLTGSGDDVVLLDATVDGTTGMRVQHLGQGPITVLAYTANGDLDQLVDGVGPLDETTVIPADTICFEVRAVGRWSLLPG